MVVSLENVKTELTRPDGAQASELENDVSAGLLSRLIKIYLLVHA